jgi:ABC-type dipeptide/oligopeptide/nickel transport system permease subunit
VLIVGFGSVAFGAALGMPIGIVSGYMRGATDDILMRLMDAIVAFPGLVLALGLIAARGPSVENIIFAIGLANIPFIARVTRGQALAVREQDYIMASVSVGASSMRIMFRHVLPNTMAPIIVQSTLGMAYAVLAEAGLSFLGVGVRPPTPSWGQDLQFAFGFMNHQPLVAIVPGVAIFVLVLSLNLLGDALRDVLDPRLRGSI